MFCLHGIHALLLATARAQVNGRPPQERAGAVVASARTDEEERRLEELRAELRQLLGVEAAPAAAPAADDGPVVSIDSGGFRVRSADGESSIQIGGRMHADLNEHAGEGSLDPVINDGTELRRARFELKGTLPESLSWAAELEFADNRTAIRDFWLGYATGAGPGVFVGFQKQPYSLDIEMSSNDIPFVERGIDTALILPFIDRAIGVRVQDSTESFFYAAGVYGEGAANNPVDDEGWGLAGRAIYAPVRSEEQVVHLGARAAYRAPDDGAESIRIRNETTNMSNFAVVDTTTLADVDAVLLYGPEAFWARGRFSLGGELNFVEVDRAGSDADFGSWNVQATWSLTGESRAAAYRIDAGEFKRLRAGKDGGRPLELAARVAAIDLEDGAVTGGEAQTLTLAVNWYWNANVRLMLDWTSYLDTSGGSAATADAEGLDVFTLRVQLTF